MFYAKRIIILTLCILLSHVYIPVGFSQTQDKKKVGVFVNSQTFDGKDAQQLQEYQALLQRMSLQKPNLAYKSYPVKTISNDALVLAKAALDQIQTLIILKKVSPSYIAVSLWDVQNYELIGEGAFENRGNRKLIDDFSDWFKVQDFSLFRQGIVDQEIFSRQLITQKECDVLKKYTGNSNLPSDKITLLLKDCELKQSFSQLLSGKKKHEKYEARNPALIKVSSKQLNTEKIQDWQRLLEDSTFIQNLGQYDILSAEFNVLCSTDKCKNLSLDIQIVAYKPLSFKNQYRLCTLILTLLDSAKKTFSQNTFHQGAKVTFYNEYNPINTLHIKGTVEKPEIINLSP